MMASLLLYLGNVRAGRLLHSKFLRNMIVSPMSFFDTTPTGRILNRFGKDIDIVDSVLAQNIQAWLACFLRVLSVPVIIAYSTPLFIAAAIPLFIFYVLIQVCDAIHELSQAKRVALGKTFSLKKKKKKKKSITKTGLCKYVENFTSKN